MFSLKYLQPSTLDIIDLYITYLILNEIETLT